MKKILTIRNYLLLLLLICIIFRVRLIIHVLELLFQYFIFLSKDFSGAIAAFDFSVADYSISAILIIVLTVYLIISKSTYLSGALSYLNVIVISLLFLLLFTPIIADQHPDFQKDLKMTRLLPPFSVVKSIKIKTENNSIADNEFLKDKEYVIKKSYNNNILFIDSLKENGDNLILFQKNSKKSISRGEVEYKMGRPVIFNNFYLLGTDHLGRDIFVRLIYGARISILIGIGSVIVSLIIGLTLGFGSGYFKGTIDIIINRISEIFLTFPLIYLIILILALFGNNVFSVILVLGLSGWMTLQKIVRNEVISITNKDFFITSQKLGMAKRKLFMYEIFPLIAAPIIVNIVLQFGNVIMTEAALSFLGLGTGTNYPSWGAMIEEGQQYLTKAWWMLFFPGAALLTTLLVIQSAGDKFQKYLNPKITE